VTHDAAFAAFRARREELRAATQLRWGRARSGGGVVAKIDDSKVVFAGPMNSRGEWPYGRLVGTNRQVAGWASTLSDAKLRAAHVA
jgi:hypothetical protein